MVDLIYGMISKITFQRYIDKPVFPSKVCSIHFVEREIAEVKTSHRKELMSKYLVPNCRFEIGYKNLIFLGQM